MTMTSGTPRSRRRGLYGLLAGGLLSASAATLIALPVATLPVANAQCDQTVGNSIDSYLKRHPDLHQQLQAKSEAEGGVDVPLKSMLMYIEIITVLSSPQTQ